MTDKPHILIGMYMIHKGAYKLRVYVLRMGFMYTVSEITAVCIIQKCAVQRSFPQHWSVLKSV